ncbi:MAG TPA: hypothetical protein VI072_20370 [Polyangiaceae bacterium]
MTRAAVPPSPTGRDQGGPNASNSVREIVLNQAGVQPEHAIAEALKLVIAARISGAAVLMVRAAIDLDDELGRGSEEVDDEAVGKHDLAPELHTETATAKHQLPEPLLTGRWTLTHGVSALSEEQCQPLRTLGATESVRDIRDIARRRSWLQEAHARERCQLEDTRPSSKARIVRGALRSLGPS